MVETTFLKVRAALPKGVNPLPFFRSKVHDMPVRVTEEVLEEYTRLLGLDCGFRMLPYLKQDRYGRERKETDLKAIVLENDHLRATFLPTLGGRMISLLDKDGGRELLYDNRNIQVANLANRDAWFAGGIEWNIGQYGHAFHTASDVHFAKINDNHIRMYDFERCKRLLWRIDFILPRESRFLLVRVTIENRNEERQSLYYWTNIALYQDSKTRVFASSRDALYLDTNLTGEKLFGWMTSPDIPLEKGIDASFPDAFPLSEEYFFTCNHDAMPWEVGMQADGNGFLEASTHPLSYRKMFCWGHGRGGRHWQRYLSPEREGEYVEIQSGLAPSQIHGLYIEGKSSVSWLQAMGAIHADADGPYDEARENVTGEVKKLLSPELLAQWNSTSLDCPVERENILHSGDGWGYLELRSEGEESGRNYRYEKSDLAPSLLPWLTLLEEGTLPSYDPLSLPPVLSEAWKRRLLEAKGDESTRLYYLAIMAAEEGEDEEAIALFSRVYGKQRDAASARNIASLYRRNNEGAMALRWYRKCAASRLFAEDPAFIEECVDILLEEGAVGEARVLLRETPFTSSRIDMLKARLAARTGDARTLEALLKKGFSNVREGECPYDKLWADLIHLKWGGGEERTREHERKLLREHPLPFDYDFLMFRPEE